MVGNSPLISDKGLFLGGGVALDSYDIAHTDILLLIYSMYILYMFTYKSMFQRRICYINLFHTVLI